MTLTEAREVVEKLKHPGSVIFLDDPHHADEYIGRCKSFIAGHKAALESGAVKTLIDSLEGYAECGDGCTCGDGWGHGGAKEALARFNQFKEAQK